MALKVVATVLTSKVAHGRFWGPKHMSPAVLALVLALASLTELHSVPSFERDDGLYQPRSQDTASQTTTPLPSGSSPKPRHCTVIDVLSMSHYLNAWLSLYLYLPESLPQILSIPNRVNELQLAHSTLCGFLCSPAPQGLGDGTRAVQPEPPAP